MLFRQFARAAVACLILSTSAVAAANESSVEAELNRLSRIVNNNLPSQYRDQLNGSIDRLREAAVAQCGGGQTVPAKPTCEVKKNSVGNFGVYRGDDLMSQYTRYSAIDSANDHKELAAAGICKAGELLGDCYVGKNSVGNFVVIRNGEVGSQYSRYSALDSANDMRELANAGLCR